MSLLDPMLLCEDEEALWEAEVSGVKLWPFIRSRVYNFFIQRQSHFEAAHKIRHVTRLSPKVWHKHLHTLRVAAQSSRLTDHSVLFYVSARPSASAINRYYYDAVPQSLVVESTWNGSSTSESSKNGSTFILEEPFLFWAYFRAKTSRLSKTDEKRIDEFALHVCQIFDLPDLHSYFSKYLSNSLKMSSVLRKLFAQYLLPRLDQRLAFVQNASYMDRYSIIVNLLHEAGFQVAEAQHGTVYDAHPAYNFSPQLINQPNHPGRTYLPDYLLGFGNYWSSQIRIPSTFVPIGLPHLSELAAQIQRNTPVQQKQILIISQGILTSKMVEIATQLSKAFSNYHIVFKLHPGEIPFRSRYTSLYSLLNVDVKEEDNIHTLIAESAIIVGATSTALYEALIFPDKRIFILENAAVPDSIGTKFTLPEQLIAFIADENVGHPTGDPALFWDAGWRDNMMNFLKAHLH